MENRVNRMISLCGTITLLFGILSAVVFEDFDQAKYFLLLSIALNVSCIAFHCQSRKKP